MKNFINKVNNDPTSAGIVDASDYNSVFSETKGVVSPFMTLNESIHNQLIQSIDVASKAMFYKDIGSVNTIVLTRSATSAQIETMVDGMVVIFSPSHTNTGQATMKIAHLPAYKLTFKGAQLPANAIHAGGKYISIYDQGNAAWDIDLLTTGALNYTKAEVDALIASSIAPGVIVKTMGTRTSLTGYLPCTGAAVSRAAFPDLFAEIGLNYTPAGTAASLFSVPDVRGYFFRSVEPGKGIGTVEQDQFKSHTHARTSDGSKALSESASGAGGHVNWIENHNDNEIDYNTQTTGATGGLETRPKNFRATYFIKF